MSHLHRKDKLQRHLEMSLRDVRSEKAGAQDRLDWLKTREAELVAQSECEHGHTESINGKTFCMACGANYLH